MIVASRCHRGSAVSRLVFGFRSNSCEAARSLELCDNGQFHQGRTILEWLNANSDRITVRRQPPSSPSLNLIERQWGHRKRTVRANIIFETLDGLTIAFRKGVGRVSGRRDRMGSMYDRDDLLGKTR